MSPSGIHMTFSCFPLKVYYRVYESKEKENGVSAGASETHATDVVLARDEEGEISKIEGDDDVHSSKIEDFPVRED